MNELDELLEWIWVQYLDEAGIIGRQVRNGIEGNSRKHTELRTAGNRMEAYDRVMRQIRVMQERSENE